MLKKERICDCERNQVNENNVIININEEIKDINEYLLVKDLLKKSKEILNKFEINIYSSKEFKTEILKWIKENIYLAGIISITYLDGVFNIASNSDEDGFRWLISTQNRNCIPNKNIKMNFHELDNDFTFELVSEKHYFYSELLDKDFLLINRESSSDYYGENFRETCYLENYDLPKLIYNTIIENKQELEELYG